MSALRGPNYITMSTLAKKLDYQDVTSAAKWVEKRGIPRHARSNKVWVVKEEDVDRALAGESTTGRVEGRR